MHLDATRRWHSTRIGGALAGALAFVAAVVAGGGAIAQVTAVGPTAALYNTTMRGVDAAYDPTTGGFLVVGAYGQVIGLCVNSSGAITSALITIKPNSTTYGAFPRARYSPHANNGAGGFLVVWPEEQVGGTIVLKSRIVTCGGPVGAEQVIDAGLTSWQEAGAAIAYSATSQKFLVVWETIVNARIVARLLDANGVGLGSPVGLSSGFGRDPSVAWNPTSDEFGISFSGESGSTSYSAFVRLPTSNPAAFTRNSFNSITGGMTAITDIDYVPATNRYLMTWYEMRSTGTRYAMIAEFDAAGTLVTQGVGSGALGSYDALSLAHNPVSGTSLLVGLNPITDDVSAAELNSRGYRFAPEVRISTTTVNRYTRVAASLGEKRWASSFSGNNFRTMALQIAQTSASQGGPSGANGGGSSGGSTGGGGSTSSCPGTAPVAGWVCVNGNWLPPEIAGTSGGSGTTCPGTSPGTGWTCVNGNWTPPSTGTSCPGTAPVAGWVCVNGNWLPPEIAGTSGGGSTGGGSTGGGSTSSCPGTAPVAGWVCVNGNWLPPEIAGTSGGGSTGGGSTSSCPGTAPVAGWVCVNGNWLPPEIAGTSGGGGSTTSCPGSAPATGWVCVNGNWLPPDIAGGCTTPSPGTGFTCVSGNWYPPGYFN